MIGNEFITDYNQACQELGFPEFKIILNSEYVAYLKETDSLDDSISEIYNPNDMYATESPMGTVSFNIDKVLENCDKMVLSYLIEKTGLKI